MRPVALSNIYIAGVTMPSSSQYMHVDMLSLVDTLNVDVEVAGRGQASQRLSSVSTIKTRIELRLQQAGIPIRDAESFSSTLWVDLTALYILFPLTKCVRQHTLVIYSYSPRWTFHSHDRYGLVVALQHGGIYTRQRYQESETVAMEAINGLTDLVANEILKERC